MSRRDAEVIVVGGGPAGATTAWALARGGRDVLVLDRATFPRPKPCAEYISPEACRVFSTMGVMDAITHAGAVRLTGMRVRSPNGTELVGEFGAARGLVGTNVDGIALRRELLDPLLLEAARAAGALVREAAHVVDVSRDQSHRVEGVVLADGSTLRARLVIGADGLRSVIARRLELGVHGRWPRRIALVSHHEGVEGFGLHGEMHVEHDGYVGIARVDSGQVNVSLVVPATDARRAAADPAAFVTQWLARRPQLAPRFARARRCSPVRATGPFAWRTRRAWAPGVALVGDAAEFFDPFTGEGIYAAVRGAEVLAPYVHAACAATGERGEREALEAYDRSRRDVFGGKWKVERLVGLAVACPAFMNRAARGLARRRDLADTFVGVTGDVVPASAVLSTSFIMALTRAALS